MENFFFKIMRVGPYIVQNIHLFNAFHLRKEGRYQETFAEVQKGCDENDPESIYYMSRIYFYGGLGIKKDQKKCEEFYYKAKKLKYPPSLDTSDDVYFLIIHYSLKKDTENTDKYMKLAIQNGHPFISKLTLMTAYLENLKLRAEWGDLDAMRHLKTDEYILCGANQSCWLFFSDAADIYEKNNNHIECVKFTILSENMDIIHHRIHDALSYDEHICLSILYLFGEANCKGVFSWHEEIDPLVRFLPPRIYNDTKRKVNQTIQSWLLVSKRIGFYRDIVRHVAQILYNRRIYPKEWGVRLEMEGDTKKCKYY